MCGLLGMAGEFFWKEKDILRDMFVVFSLRGEDSAGLAGITKTNDVRVAKTVGTPYDLFNSSNYIQAECIANGQAFIGHCRKATVGGISKYTAHPFENDAVVGVHNGTLENHRIIERELEGNYPSDSAILFAAFEQLGVKETIEKVKGAYAIVWWDKRDHTLNFIRNDKRDLWMAFSADSNQIYWASEWRMLNLTLDRNGVKLWENKDGIRFFQMEPDKLWKYKPAKSGKDKLTLVSQEELKGGTNAPFAHTTHTVKTVYGSGATATGVGLSKGKGGEVKNPFQGIPPAVHEEVNPNPPASSAPQVESSTTNTTSMSGKTVLSLVHSQPSKPLQTHQQESKGSGSKLSNGRSCDSKSKEHFKDKPFVVGRHG